ncbi:fumarylacetoacetate hydrolase family protein [Lentzea flaviverrucosa]|uniref:2-keto-4-pentenoate hydratase/2-oxohepta-3-ene-1,7-dioic acid hydratase (Catechol pathway) n=1 Tax=Lentzea flaviverrucosa TaxID=200379 RepID=A0A1H9H4I9_9PSEU|nr:fumarylacetoacetate hydrolase family protein [Lentzea flaviverrucosa]RDI34703.1 2-keto-4-pentenoate hydratase/2-oxohepta-3-ene-1,7-dioic acid hydratase in catechol pathway [Lentzea flaviverrucosa]SEQ57261.1 2-keto-4-pentenoate hydratase/2-oxohepta-3-ene-1,7-dioic acid hydratase (catechol pathway) [Lentzea flaviverrucosa]
MRFATYLHDGRKQAGVLDDERLRPLGTASLIDVLGDLPGAAALAGPAGPHVSEVRLLAPLQPPTVRDFVTFEEHVEGMRAGSGVPEQWYAAPTFYFGNPYAVIGPHDDVPVPPGSELLDFELEVAAVISREGRDLTPEQARDHIAGYTIFNDWSARDLQTAEMAVGLGPCKGKDTATTLGPWLVTPDELEHHRDADGLLHLELTAEVNGRVVGSDLLSNMSWTFEEMVAYASRGTAVRPGDVLGSGTCGNGGCLAELWGRGAERHPLRPGDVVTLTVEGIGAVSTTVVPGAEVKPLPRARRRPRRTITP